MVSCSRRRWFLLWAAVAYALLPPVISRIFFQGSLWITGTHAIVSDLGLAFLVLRSPGSRDRVLGLSFLLAAVADSIFMVTGLLPDRESLFVVHVGEALYLLFFLMVSLALERQLRPILRGLASWLVQGFTFAAFVVLNWFFVVKPYFSRPLAPSLFFKVVACGWSLVTAYVAALALEILLRTRVRQALLLASAALLMVAGDFGIRYAVAVAEQTTFPYFEFAWEVGMALLLVSALLWRPFSLQLSLAPLFGSLRAATAAYVTIGVLAFLGLLLQVGLVRVGDAFSLSTLLLLLLAVLAVSNFVALEVSSRFLNLGEKFLDAKEPRPAEDLFRPLPLQAMFQEVQALVERHNALAEEGKRLVGELRRQSAVVAVARAAQMMAHDLRKPFSVLDAALTQMSRVQTPREMHAFLTTTLPEIRSARGRIDKMISDMLAHGTESRPRLVPCVVAELVNESLRQMFAIQGSRSSINISYSLKATRAMKADEQLTVRVFSNILVNAANALGGQGEIWISSEDVELEGISMVRVEIANSGPLIPEDALDRIFEDFFTTGDGLGIGLSISRRLVALQCGRISCRNSPRVTFTIELPATESPAVVPCRLLSSSTDFWGRVPPLTSGFVRVLIVDDEAFFLRAMERQLSAFEGLKGAVTAASDLRTACAAVRELRPCLLIADVNLGNGDSGLDVVRLFRELNPFGVACVHSNHLGSQFEAEAREAGADLVLAKPASPEDLARVLALVPGYAELSAPAVGDGPCVVVVDDSPTILEAWHDALSAQVRVFCYASPSELQAAWERAEFPPDAVSLFLLDYLFSPGEISGSQLAVWIRARSSAPLLFSTDYQLRDLEGADGCLEKRILSWDELHTKLRRLGR